LDQIKRYQIKLKNKAYKDLVKIQKDKAKFKKLKELLEIISTLGPFATPPNFESLVGDLKGLYSRRLNIQDRLVYAFDEAEQTIIIFSILTHYEKL
jgi:toxin YoeB